MKKRVVVIGSLNADYVVSMNRFPRPGETIVGNGFAVFPGGKGANQSYAAARLGGTISMVGQVGADAQGSWLKKHLESAGVDASFVGQDKNVSSGVASISIDHAGQNSIVIVPGANGTFGADRLMESRELIRAAAIVLLQLEIPIETVHLAARLAKDAGALVILDPAPAMHVSNDLLEIVDYLTPNETELATLVGTPPDKEFDERSVAGKAHELRARGARKVIVKLGARGALLVTKDEEQWWPALPVAAVDTTAAGDWFNAGLAVALWAGEAEPKSGMFATAAAACAVMRKGAQPGDLTSAEVEELLKQHQSN